MDAAEFERALLGLRSGDEVTFVFRSQIHWATMFLALFNTEPKSFSIIPDQSVNWKVINYFMLTNAVYFSTFAVRCTVLTGLKSSGISVDWMVEYILPLLESFEVSKREERNPDIQ
ncbi:hypothetical protein A3K01_00340 [candidate division WWE3 bacterium RIFOXYD1_FULL_43_17]|uniref:Uncharacterized protein n=2 Tax=Katanobacteria TaxID=422282 RepID=A0A1F4XC49_UNCKA|nr:MAG: hypothetical protein UU59_C0005G0004 [candidate division WWE3 bacterium GW2011_GWE1_41_27]OGC79234.1 MAG: hypothetical protein A3K01_00340 [candidate division WWE3 bacterium RIFOXYD1_FULL_43_17]